MRRAFFLPLLFATPALAQEPCEVCRLEDEIQAGDYVAPLVATPRRVTPSDPRGKPLSLPIAGSPTIHHRPGAGVWVGEVGEGNNLFVNARRNKAMLGLRREF